MTRTRALPRIRPLDRDDAAAARDDARARRRGDVADDLQRRRAGGDALPGRRVDDLPEQAALGARAILRALVDDGQRAVQERAAAKRAATALRFAEFEPNYFLTSLQEKFSFK